MLRAASRLALAAARTAVPMRVFAPSTAAVARNVNTMPQVEQINLNLGTEFPNFEVRSM